ncbi:putative Receptor-like serine/threonine-protein kinase SD1-8 [Cocos nucifera]|uniref:non-specific serine/threonine protein kinase n=1 Tax=Cocos nucifera TaxID=13894 RepID=A0A8K0N359_COCNU|nr:putative Receptor-like serine/threonine-protein kinase SD1-8 [Cocos nucifera]
MTPTKSIVDGQTLISSDGTFELGFFSPGDSKNRYLGIHYRGTPDKTVWVANRVSPLNGSTGVLNLTGDGNLVLLNGTGYIFWSTGTSNAINPVVQLQDTGNLVLSEGTSKKLLWQSFDYPSDTLLPRMKLGYDLRINLDRKLTSWKSSSDPSPGDCYYKLHTDAVPELVVWRGSVQIYRSGPWNGGGVNGIPETKTNNMFRFNLTSNESEKTYTFEVLDNSILSRVVVNETGVVQRWVRSKPNRAWDLYWWFPKDPCDNYANCGANGVCNTSYSPSCDCLRGFSPKSPQNWKMRINSDGCVRRTALKCSSDRFFELHQVKLPDTSNATVHSSKNLEECGDWCLKNCTCSAHAIIDGSGCVTWTGDLVDIRLFTEGRENLYVRLASSELGPIIRDGYGKKKPVIIIFISSLAGFLLFVRFIQLLRKKNREKKRGETISTHSRASRGNELELPLFDIHTIRTATNNFSEDNKLGEGGFGPVYKGQLEDGEKIAVKRLSKASVQGIHEFTNEVLLIAKLQHRNLVRLLGCCIEGEERLLVYEYLQNTSLVAIFDLVDHNLFLDFCSGLPYRTRSAFLNWQKRLDIIIGIARGLLYLHQDSRLKIIHRDLKASNILLDKELNPKISDFGTARTFKVDQTEENTKRVVGTYGYMSPEYAMDGIFSVKSDVFSFGVLVLEILSGDIMTATKSIVDGQTLSSSGGNFELGFFNPDDSKNRYLGIHYRGTPDKTVVWVANRISPLNGSTGVLNLTGDGNLVLLNSTGFIIWSTGTSNALNPVVQLLDSGNLVLIEGTSKNLLWQSFDHPSNILLPGMKLGWDLRTNVDRHLTSWKSSSDPSPADYYYKLHTNAVPELVLWRGSAQIYIARDPGMNVPEMKTNNMFRFNLISNEYETTYTYEVLDNSVVSHLLLNETGVVQRLVWSKPKLVWDLYWWLPKEPCDEYAKCGANGVCSTSYSPACDCLRGFSPKSPQNWRLRDNSDGCVRRTALNCSSDGFFELQQVKLPETSNATVHSNRSPEECEDWCLKKNCTCSAYAINEGSGCVTWTGDLVDIRLFTEGGENLYVRLASSELGQIIRGSYHKKKTVMVIIISSLAGFLLFVCFIQLLRKKNRKRKQEQISSTFGTKNPSNNFMPTNAAK